MKLAQIVKALVGLAVGAVCLVLAFSGVSGTEQETGVSLGAVLAQIGSVPVTSHLAFFSLFVVQFVLRTERWRVQVRGLTGKLPGLRESLAINAAAFAGVFLLPFRLGEFVRPNLSAARGIMRASAGLAASVLERVIDGMVTTGFFAVVLLFMRERDVPGYVRIGGWTALTVFGGATAFLVVAYLARERTIALVLKVLSLFGARIANRVTSMLEGFLLGLSCFKRPTDVLAYVGLTVLYWLLNALSMWVLMRGLGLDVPVIAAFFCLCFLVIGMMMPAPPGNVGNFHAFARAALTIFGVGIGPAVAYAILLHAATTLAVVLWMLVFFATRDLTFGGLKKAASSAADDAAAAPATPATAAAAEERR